MSEPIKVGDLVVVVHSCCSDTREGLGQVFRVSNVRMCKPHGILCRKCGYTGHEMMAEPEEETKVLSHAPFSWLKRIPPLGELDDVRQDEEITA